MLMLIGTILLAVGGIMSLYLLVKAFQTSTGTGLLALFVPFYLLYFAFAKYTSPKKGMVVGAWLGLLVAGGVLQGIGVAQAANEMADQMQQLQFAAPPAANVAAE